MRACEVGLQHGSYDVRCAKPVQPAGGALKPRLLQAAKRRHRVSHASKWQCVTDTSHTGTNAH